MRFQLIRVQKALGHILFEQSSPVNPGSQTQKCPSEASTFTIVAPIRAFTNYLNKVGEHQEEAKSKFGHRKALFWRQSSVTKPSKY